MSTLNSKPIPSQRISDPDRKSSCGPEPPYNLPYRTPDAFHIERVACLSLELKLMLITPTSSVMTVSPPLLFRFEILFLISWKPSTWMPECEEPYRNNDGSELQPTEECLMRHQIPKDTFTRLDQPKDRPQVHQNTSDLQRNNKRTNSPQHRPELSIPNHRNNEHRKQHKETRERESLNSQPSKHNIIRHLRTLQLALRIPDHRSPCNLR